MFPAATVGWSGAILTESVIKADRPIIEKISSKFDNGMGLPIAHETWLLEDFTK